MRPTHAHWGTAARFLLDVSSDPSGQILWTDAKLSQEGGTIYQYFIAAQSLNVMGVTAKDRQL